MPELSTYSLSDFVMFSPSVYYRLFELENQRLWPYHVFVPVAGIVATAMILRANARSRRAAIVMLASAWIVCAWVYFRQSYSTIHTFGNAFAIVFVVQAAALLLQAAAGASSDATIARPIVERAGFALVVYAIFVQPPVFFVLGRPLIQTELFAFMPDPTVLATIGVLAAIPDVVVWLFLVPLVWSLYSGLTLYSMGSDDAFVPLLQAAIALMFGISRWRDRRAI